MEKIEVDVDIDNCQMTIPFKDLLSEDLLGKIHNLKSNPPTKIQSAELDSISYEVSR